MKRRCLYRCPKCGTEKTISMSDPTWIVVTCTNGCTDNDGWRTVMKLMEEETP